MYAAGGGGGGGGGGWDAADADARAFRVCEINIGPTLKTPSFDLSGGGLPPLPHDCPRAKEPRAGVFGTDIAEESEE